MIAVAGCGSAPHGPDVSDSDAGCDRLMADPRIDPVRSQILVPLSLEASQDVALIANTERPTDAERPAVKALWEAHEACRTLTEARFGPMPRHWTRSQDAVSALLGELYDGAISYGQFARKILYVGAQYKSARETLDEELEARARWRALDNPAIR